MNKLLVIFLLTGTLSSCINEDEQKGIDAVQTIVQSEKIAVGSGTSVDSKKGNLNYKTLTLKSGNNLNDPEVSNESISSISALTFYQNISSSTLDGKDGIKIILERKINGNLITVESLYFKDTLAMVNKTLIDCKILCEGYINKNYNEVYKQLYDDVKKSYAFQDFEAEMKRLDKELGGTKSYLITGYKMKNATKKGGPKFPVVHFWVNLNRDSITNKLDLDYSLDPNVKGVLNLDL